MTVDSVWAAIAAVVLMALFNAVVRVAVLVLVAPYTPVLTGILVLVFQVLAFLIASNVVPGVHLSGVVSALIASLVYAAINTVLTAILGIDQGDSYYGRLLQADARADVRAEDATSPASWCSRSTAWRTRSSPRGSAPDR